MLTKNHIKQLRELAHKRGRDARRLFLAEGPKAVGDLIGLMSCEELYVTATGRETLGEAACAGVRTVEEVAPAELARISQLRTPQGVVGVFRMPAVEADPDELVRAATADLCLALDCVQDPGNLGTIVRLADWFGITHIFASPDTADVFAPKVVQATMGAIGRVKVCYVDLPDILHRCTAAGAPVYGTFLDAPSVYDIAPARTGVIVMGNEGRGISPAVGACVTQRIHIPHYPATRTTGDSLNVAVATAIVCAEMRRAASRAQ